jgi:hypothetical protein
MWSKDGEPKRTPRSQTAVLEGDPGSGCVVRLVVWERKFLSPIVRPVTDLLEVREGPVWATMAEWRAPFFIFTALVPSGPPLIGRSFFHVHLLDRPDDRLPHRFGR